MNDVQRRVTLALSLIVGLTFLVSAGLTFLITPMAAALRLSNTTVTTLLAVPSVTALPVVFLAGGIGDRHGHRRTLIPLGGCFALGGLLLMSGFDRWSLGLGLACCGSSAMAIQIVALALLQRTVPEGKAHVAAFTTFGMVYPLAFLIVPVATSGLLGVLNWRWIPLGWALAGGLISALAATRLEPDEAPVPIGEWLTPLLAGMAFAISVRLLEAIGQHSNGWWSADILLRVMAVPLIAWGCAALMRHSADPGFSLRPIRSGTVRVLLAGVGLASLLGTLSYVTISAEYLYGLSTFQASLAMVPAQAGGIVGAKLVAGWVMERWGLRRAEQGLLLLLGATMLPLLLLLLGTGTPMLLFIAWSTLLSTLALATVTVFNTDVMGRAPERSSGPMSAFRGAASSIGSALGVVVLAAGVTNAVPMDAAPGAATPQQLAHLADALRLNGLQGCALALACWLALRATTRAERQGGPGS